MHIDKKILKVAVVYEGSFFWRISNYYRFSHNQQSYFNVNALHSYFRHRIAGLECDGEVSLCQISESHFFRGRFSLKAVQSKRDPVKQMESDRFQDQILMWAGVVSHYLPMNESTNPPEEKGVYINLVLETYDMVVHKGLDVVVLFSGATDLVPLVNKIQSLGARVMVPVFDIPEYAKTSQRLVEEAVYALPLSDLLDEKIKDEYPLELEKIFT